MYLLILVQVENYKRVQAGVYLVSQVSPRCLAHRSADPVTVPGSISVAPARSSAEPEWRRQLVNVEVKGDGQECALGSRRRSGGLSQGHDPGLSTGPPRTEAHL